MPQAAGAAGRDQRPADRRPAARRRHRSRHGRAPRDVAARRSTRRSTTPSGSGRSRRSTRSSTSTRSSSRCCRSSSTTRPRCRASTSPAPSGAQVPLSTVARFSDERRAADHQPPGPVPRGHDLVQPRARHCARPGGRAHRADAARPQACRAPSTAASRARRRPSRPRWPATPLLIAGGDPRRLHRARHALRELHPPDHHPLDACPRPASARCSR